MPSKINFEVFVIKNKSSFSIAKLLNILIFTICLIWRRWNDKYKLKDNHVDDITEFDEDLWSGLADYILVKDKEDYIVVFKNVTEVDV